MPVQTPPPPAAAIAPIATYFTGNWTCSGSFSNGKPISATIRVEPDVQGAAIVVHHDDTPALGSYHSIELWGYQKSNNAFVATLFDAYSGTRTFSSPGWAGDVLTWTTVAPEGPAQQFAYTKKDTNAFVVEWKVFRGGSYTVGDTLTCGRSSG